MTESDDRYENTGCIRCGDCCEHCILAEDLVNSHRSSFQRTVIREQRFPAIGQVFIRTADGRCVFLLPDNTCAIYPDRPLIPCRVFGIPEYLECPKVAPDGTLRSRQEYDRIVAKNSDRAQWSDEYRRLVEEEAEKYIDNLMKRKKPPGEIILSPGPVERKS